MAIKINVDAGHGSNTAGKRTPPMPQAIDINGDSENDIIKGEQYREHYANVGVANFLVKELERCGFDTMRTGWDDDNAYDDPDQALSDRQRAIAKAGCDYSISIHFNAFGDGKTFNSAEGVEVYIHNQYAGQSKKLAEAVLNHLVGGTKQKDRGVMPASLAMCNGNNMDVKAAILCELAFMTNLREATELMANEGFWEECAQEICRGVCEYTGIMYIPKDYIPEKAITPESDPRDIMWAQKKLNTALPDWLPRLEVDGNYGSKTRIATLIYWDGLGWGRHMQDDGTKIGKSTREALAAGRNQ
ncbi:MAG: N-acetylmuramoyl-L-alanine amidase [Lachnospiraceae bacterium]|nr:N-acetylmuramoyl-L-alanine amidase [Lachnospiraceae bacterium]